MKTIEEINKSLGYEDDGADDNHVVSVEEYKVDGGTIEGCF